MCSAVLEAALREGEGAARRKRLEAVMEGYCRFAPQPRRRLARGRGYRRVELVLHDPRDDSLWAVRRHLDSTDFRRWPPAVQALLRLLFLEVAAAPEAQLLQRTAAAIRLARLQARVAWGAGRQLCCLVVTSRSAASCPLTPLPHPPGHLWQDACPADLEPLLGDAQMQSCLLCASDMPDKRAASRFLASLVRAPALAPGRACLLLAAASPSLPPPMLFRHACSNAMSLAPPALSPPSGDQGCPGWPGGLGILQPGGVPACP